MNFKGVIEKIKKQKRLIIYFISSIFSVGLAFLINSILTKNVNPEVFGLYKYATNFLLVVPSIFEFGIHFSVSRIIADRDSNIKDSVVLSGSFLVAVMGLLLTFGMYIFMLITSSMGNEPSTLLDISIVYPFIVVFALRILVLQVYQGIGNTNMLSIINVAQYLIIIIGIYFGFSQFNELNFQFLILLFCLSWILVMVPYFLSLNYKRINFKESINEIYKETINNGLFVYLGTIVTTISSNIIGLISGSLYGYQEYGFYSLALSFSQAFSIIASVMTVVKFKENVKQKYIETNDLKIMLGLNILLYLFLVIFIRPIFNVFFTPEFYPAIKYLLILGVVYSLNGIILYYNRFFVARGYGRITTKNSLYIAVVNIIFAIILIPRLEIIGLVLASLFGSIAGLLLYLYSYKSYKKLNEE